jgi:hypothetical protein
MDDGDDQSLLSLRHAGGMRVFTQQTEVLGQSEPAVSRRRQSDKRVQNNTKRSLCAEGTMTLYHALAPPSIR